MSQKYSGPGEIISIALEPPNPAFPNRRLKLIGYMHDAARTDVTEILGKFWQYNFPSHWQNILPFLTLEQELTVHNLVQGSNEWTEVAQRFNLTMPQAQVVKIERIQNRKLWRVFNIEVEEVQMRIGGPAPIMRLYHGTSETPPRTVFMSEEGFNMNYSRDGMWGRANYFA